MYMMSLVANQLAFTSYAGSQRSLATRPQPQTGLHCAAAGDRGAQTSAVQSVAEYQVGLTELMISGQ